MSVEQSAQSIADALAPAPSIPSARWRWGTVRSVNPTGTMNVEVGGAVMPSIRCAQHVMGANVGDRVRVMFLGTEAIVDAVRAVEQMASIPTIDGEMDETSKAAWLSALGLGDTGWRTIAGEAPSKTVHNNGMRVRRIGNVVQVDLRAGGAWNGGTIGTTPKNLSQTIPAGYRPASYVQFPGSVPGSNIHCYAAVNAGTGAVSIYCSANTYYYTFSQTWLTEDDWPS